MKKICSLMLAVCFLFASCMLFASCNAISEDDLLTDPQAVLNDAAESTFKSFFTDDAGISKALISMLPSGALTVSFESDDIEGESLKLNETVYYNIIDRGYVFDTNIVYSDLDLYFRMYSDSENFAVNSKDILGSDKTLLLNFDTFIEKFGGSEIAKLLELDKNSVDAAVDYVKTVKESLNSKLTEDEEKSRELSNAIYSILLDEVTTEKAENADGKNLSCVVATFKFTNESIEEVLNVILEKAEFDENSKKTNEESFKKIIKTMNEETIIDLSVKLYLNKRTNEYVKVVIDGTVTDLSDKENPALVEGEVLFGKNDITFDIGVNYDNEPATISAKLTKTVSSEGSEYKLTVDATEEEEIINAFNASFKYDKATGDITVSADTYIGEESRTTALLEGNLSVTEEKISLVFDSYKEDEETYEFKLEVSVTSDVTVPSIPADAMDIVDITEGGWVDIFNEFAESKIGKLLYGEPEYDF